MDPIPAMPVIPAEFEQLLRSHQINRLVMLFSPKRTSSIGITPERLVQIHEYKIVVQYLYSKAVFWRAFLKAARNIRFEPRPYSLEVRHACLFYQGEEAILELYTSRLDNRGVFCYRGSPARDVVVSPAYVDWMLSCEVKVTNIAS